MKLWFYVFLVLFNFMYCLKTHQKELIKTSFCKNHCSMNGYCHDGKCFCKPKFSNDDCSVYKEECECKNGGECADGICVCKDGYSGPDCSISRII